MRIYIVRHAIALPHGTLDIAEEDRPLSLEGIEAMKKAAAGLAALGVAPKVVLSSPLPRAVQTAELIIAACADKPALELIPSLAPSGRRSAVYREICERGDRDSIMLVGHQPSLGEIAGEIAWGSADHYLELKKGGACALELTTLERVPRGTLLWCITPAILRHIRC
jgi:phosphohistidine phosphatase